MSNSFSVQTKEFDGPLEALLNLIEGRKLSISQISLAEVTDSYLAYVERLPELPLAETSQFILVASTLLVIKSRTLLPTLEISQDERENVEELERRLARYAIFRKGAKSIRKQWGTKPLLFAKRAPTTEPLFSPAESNIQRIFTAARKLAMLLPKPEALIAASVAPVLALEDVIVDLRKRLHSAFRARFSDLTRGAGKHDVIVHFLAVLELVRSGSASVSQDKLFADISIESEVTGMPKYGTSV